MRKRIVYIISDINRSVAFEWIAARLDKKRFKISFLILNPETSQLEKYLREHGHDVHFIPCKSKKDWPAAWLKIYAYLRKQKPEAVHCHLQQATILGLSAARVAGIKKRIYTRHHSSLHHVYFPKGVWWDKLCTRMATDVIAISRMVETILRDWEKVPAHKVSTIPHGFELDAFRKYDPVKVNDLKEKYGLSDAYPVIGVISRLTEWKGVQYIVPAFTELLKEYPGAVLLLFNASGDYEEKVDGLLKALPEQHYRKVKFEPEIMSAYHLMDVFVHTPIDEHSEAFGQIYVEALAARVPSVFTLSGIAPDFIRHGENALVVPFKDEDAILAAIRELLQHEALQERLKQNGEESILHQFSLENMMDRLQELYDK